MASSGACGIDVEVRRRRVLVGLAVVFAVINGANDGGAMLAAALKARGLRLVVSLGLLMVALVVVPLIIGTRVAETLTSGLVAADPATQPWLVAVGVTAAMIVVAALTAASLPTSLTLGVVGGIVGAGISRGLPVAADEVARVLLIGIAAPIVGGLVAMGLARVVAFVLALSNGARLSTLHRIGAVVQAIAYASNDGQKMLAVVAVTSLGVTVPTLIAVAVLFAGGAVLGIPRAATTLGSQILRAGPREEVTAQLASSFAVLVSAVLGAPVSMTQALSGGLIGTGMLRGRRQVRWQVARQLALAWLMTLPAAAVVGGAIAWVVGRVA
jgi:inorganic phosphate transporter, PiT family